MQLNNENYYSKEADVHYMSVSQYHSFVGTLAYSGCYARAIAKLNGTWETETSAAMLIGSYVDAYFEGTIDAFKQTHPEIFTQKGELKADFKLAEKLIQVAESDVYFTKFIYGSEKQVIMTGEIGGVLWKIKPDYIFKDICIVDLKCVKSIRERVWVEGIGKVNYIDAGGYIDQAAVYQEIYYQNTGKRLPFYHAALSKETHPDHEIIEIPQFKMDEAMEQILKYLPDVMYFKNGDVPPHRCELCDFCRATKRLDSPISYLDL
jgi:hypothetical protein